ncbi:LTA synthase family protein [Paenibacillus sanguinis]|uniref:LTA synthase family protein n=1 Tax=Paenibacillus sanguinis TaxID=225906 RepID=UPI00035D9B90|nr:LTA synthase family protein [Paenibacillus sanguinis]
MLRFTSERGGFIHRINWLRQSRYFAYLMFILAIFIKLVLFHGQLKARYIDMSLMDDLIAIGSIMLASFWTLWLPARAFKWGIGSLNVLLTLLIFADLIYYRYFADFITVPVLMQAGQVGALGESIEELIHPRDLWLIADWALWLVALLFAQMWRRQAQITLSATDSLGPVYRANARYQEKKQNKLGRLFPGLAVFALGFMLSVGPIQFYARTWAAGLFENNWWNVSLYNVTGLLGFHYYDTSRFVQEQLGGTHTVDAGEEDAVRRWFREARPRQIEQNETFGAYAGSNVIVIQAEAFMNFMIGREIAGQEITPHFNKLMKESLYFPNYYHQTGQGRTSDADFSSNSSLHPLPTGSVAVRYPDHRFDALPQIVKSQSGYTTAAFHAYEGSFWNRNQLYPAMGYDRFYSKKDYVMDEPLGWSLGDKSFFRQSLDFMKQTKEPFYSFMITLSSHHPYSLPADARTLDTGEFEGTIFGNYLQSIHYMDEALGQFVAGLKQEGVWDRTILYVYGDHDNSVTVQQDYERFLGHKLSELDMHQIMNQVPLLIHLPDSQHAGVYPEPAGQLDMTPSLLHLLGISAEPYYFMGNNLFSSATDKRLVVLRTGAFTDGQVYYIPSASHLFEDGQCYDLTSRELTDIEPCRVPQEEAIKRLEISDTIITTNLLNSLDSRK